MLKRLEEGTKQLAAEPQRDKALVKLNDLARQFATRRAQLGGAEKIKQQLEQLKNIDRGPADKLAGALSHGDFEKAADELQKMMDQLANDKLDGPQKEALAKQLEKMQEKIKEMAAAHQAAQRELQKKVDALRRPDNRPRRISSSSSSTNWPTRPRKCSKCKTWANNSGNVPSA